MAAAGRVLNLRLWIEPGIRGQKIATNARILLTRPVRRYSADRKWYVPGREINLLFKLYSFFACGRAERQKTCMPQIPKFSVLVILILLTAIFFAGCKSARTSRSTTGNRIRHVGEDTYVKPDGWEIPAPNELKTGDSGTSHQRSADGDLIPITFTNYYPVGEIVTSEPGSLVGYEFGETKVQSVTSCSINGRIFEYSVLAASIKTSKRAGNTGETGAPFFYRYYDLNGDGLFETLVTDSSDVPVPDWAQSGD